MCCHLPCLVLVHDCPGTLDRCELLSDPRRTTLRLAFCSHLLRRCLVFQDTEERESQKHLGLSGHLEDRTSLRLRCSSSVIRVACELSARSRWRMFRSSW